MLSDNLIWLCSLLYWTGIVHCVTFFLVQNLKYLALVYLGAILEEKNVWWWVTVATKPPAVYYDVIMENNSPGCQNLTMEGEEKEAGLAQENQIKENIITANSTSDISNIYYNSADVCNYSHIQMQMRTWIETRLIISSPLNLSFPSDCKHTAKYTIQSVVITSLYFTMIGDVQDWNLMGTLQQCASHTLLWWTLKL